MASATIPMWAQVTDDLWVATLGAVHLGRVELRSEQFVAVDHLNFPIGSFADNHRAREAVIARTDSAIAYFEAGGALSAPPSSGPRRPLVTALLAFGVLAMATGVVAVVLVAGGGL